MTVGVKIGGRGPFPFVIDTGAERTVISTELAGALRLAPSASATLHSLSEVGIVPMVLIPQLTVSNATIQNIRAPALGRANMGAVGILGIDTLQDQRVILDFRKGQMTVMPAAERDSGQSGDDIVVRARSRFGRLVLADAEADGQKIFVILDTGAQLSVGNPALHARLIRKRKNASGPIELISVTGGKVQGQAALLHKVRIGGIELRDMSITIADAHIFRQLQLGNRPAILLGMDALRGFNRVSVDFANRKVRFLLPGGALRDTAIQSAENPPPQKRS
jgi:predicted aspartyl protease